MGVQVGVCVCVDVFVGVAVDVDVGVAVDVDVAVDVAVGVGVQVDVIVAVGKMIGIAVGVGAGLKKPAEKNPAPNAITASIEMPKNVNVLCKMDGMPRARIGRDEG